MAYGDVSFEGIAGEYVTFKAGFGYDFAPFNVGKALYQDVDGSLYTAANGVPILGKLILMEQDGTCNIQTGGFCKLPALGITTAAIGKQFVGDAEDGNIRAVNSANAYEIHHGRGVIVAVETNYAWVRL